MAYGLRPVMALSGGYQSGGFREYQIADGEATDMFTGDFIQREDAGYVNRLNDTTGASPTSTDDTTVTVGVAVGFRYVDANGTPIWSTWYNGNAANTDSYVFVADDPNQIFQVESDGLVATTDRSDIGQNIIAITFASNLGNTNSGISAVAVDSTSKAVTATHGLRIMGIVQNGENEFRSGTETIDIYVKINSHSHAFGDGTAVAPGA